MTVALPFGLRVLECSGVVENNGDARVVTMHALDVAGVIKDNRRVLEANTDLGDR